MRVYESLEDWAAAGRIALELGLAERALELFDKGADHEGAMLAALQLGHYDAAAAYAERTGQREQAARFYTKAGALEHAALLFKDLGRYEEAVERLEEVDPKPHGEIAALWEAHYLSLFAEPGDRLALRRQWRAASRASEAYRLAGDLTRAAHFAQTAAELDPGADAGLPPEADDAESTVGLDFYTPPAETPATVIAVTPPPLLRERPLPSAPWDVVTPIADVPAVPLSRIETLRPPVLPRSGPAEELPPDTDARRYILGAKLGEGGMAEVYEATDRILDRTVGLKLLPAAIADDDAARRQFLREAKAAARLNHHNIITIHDVGVLDGRPFICMEHIEGVSVWEMIVSAPPQGLDLRTVHDIAVGLAQALEYAHDRGVIHRDVKPSNLMWSDTGLVKLTDFGIAAVRARHEANALSGTPVYMSPEQLSARKEDQRSDIFAAGVTIFEALTGYVPFQGTSRDVPAPSARALRPSTPAPLDKLLARCLSLRVQDRPASAAEVRAELQSMRWIVEAANRAEDSRRTDLERYMPDLSGIPVPAVMRLLKQHSDEQLSEVRRVRVLFEAALRDARPLVRQIALRSFPGIWEGAFMDYLLQLATDDDEAVRETAVALLSGHPVRTRG
jgi:tRNA A-37 threonylcarbamoyl transferase component Bud32